MLLLFMLLSSCNKANLSNLKLNSLKTFEKEKSNKRDIGYVIGEDDNEEENNKKSEKEHSPDVQMNYLESPALLDILNKDKKDFEKIQREKNEHQELDIDYSESKTLLDILDEEKKNFKTLENNESYYESDFSYGYEKTIGCKDEFFC